MKHKRRNIVLIGFMGSGKTTLGLKLSYLLRMPVEDTDKMIERQEGRSISEIFADEGEAYFRELETELLRKCGEQKYERILSVGGGTPVNPVNRPLLHQCGTVVYLRVSPEVVYERLKNDTTRPLLQCEDPLTRIRELLEILLTSEGYAVTLASSGEQALQLLSPELDLVILDIMMPGMDGIELCRRIKQTFEYCHIPVILLTAKNADESRIEGYNSGADGYVTKPFNLQLLYAQIVNQLRKLEIRGLHFRNQPVFEVEKLEYTSMDEKFMRQAMACVNAHIDDCEFAQADFTREMNMSRTILTEKLKSLTGLTPAAFIIDVRLRAAYHLLEEQKKMRIADLAYASGFNDPKYFSTCFRKKFGFSPKEFIDRLNEKGDKIA